MPMPEPKTVTVREFVSLTLNVHREEAAELLAELDTFAKEFDDEPDPIALAIAYCAAAARLVWANAPADMPASARRAILAELVDVAAGDETIGVPR